MFVCKYMSDTCNTTSGKRALAVKHLQRLVVYSAS